MAYAALVADAATLQKSRSQDLSSALIRGGTLQLQPALPVPLAPGRALAPRSEAQGREVPLPFHPSINKPQRPQAAYAEHLHERVAQSRILDSQLKADCLHRLSLAQRAQGSPEPVLGRAQSAASAASAASAPREEPKGAKAVPETKVEDAAEKAEAEAEDITNEDMKREERAESSPEVPAEPQPCSPANLRPAMDAELRGVLTPTPEKLELLERARAAQMHKPSADLERLLAQNQPLFAMAGLSPADAFSWRTRGREAEGSNQTPRTRRVRQTPQGADLYSLEQGPHWRFKSSSPRFGLDQTTLRRPPGAQRRPRRDAESLAPQRAESPESPESLKEFPLSTQELLDTRQAIVAAKDALGNCGPERGVKSLLRSALRLAIQT
ncbi:unnamed protein product [Effrenium voratum]|nr:unnamed protein product [Effrenium voratum]